MVCLCVCVHSHTTVIHCAVYAVCYYILMGLFMIPSLMIYCTMMCVNNYAISFLVQMESYRVYFRCCSGGGGGGGGDQMDNNSKKKKKIRGGIFKSFQIHPL